MKAKIKDTGEVVDVHWEGDLDAWLGKLASGRFREFKERELEFLETNNIDWEQRRYEIAKEMLPITYQESRNILLRGGDVDTPDIIESAVKFADMLITELKKGGAR